MDSLSSLKLPIINFSEENLKPGTSRWVSTCKEVLHALEEYGCFVAIYDKFPLQLHNSLFKASEQLFDLPLENKSRNVSEIPYFGYLGNAPTRPLFESLGICNSTTLKSNQDFTNLMWPDGNDYFCKTMLEYSKMVAELEKMVMRMVFEGYGVKHSYESQQESIIYLLRMNSYRVPGKDEPNLGCKSHTDKSFLTVLHQNEVNGLEVKAKAGQWMHFQSSPSSLVVMAGDALLAWSNGRIHAPFHRVMMKESKTRSSVSLFSYKKGIIEVPKELVDEQNPLLFKPFDHFELMRYLSTEEGQKKDSALKAYCGL